MKDIILQQCCAAKPMTGKDFVLGVAGILLRLAIAQVIVNLLITATGVGLLNLLFYGYAIVLLLSFMRATVAGYVYTLKADELVLERRLGDSTITMMEIPLERVVSLRKVHAAENLKTTYRQVTHMDPATKPPFRMRAAWKASLLSTHLARMLAGKEAKRVRGYVLVYDEDNRLCACVFRPNAQMLGALEQMLGKRFGFDERMTHGKVSTLYARALERAFPALYPYVDPLVKPEDVARAREEVARQKAERKARNGKKGGNKR